MAMPSPKEMSTSMMIVIILFEVNFVIKSEAKEKGRWVNYTTISDGEVKPVWR